MKRLVNFLPVTIVGIISLLSILPLFHVGFFPMHDDTQVARVFEMHQSLFDGLFPVRWVQDLGYGFGYPLFSFYAPFAYYVGAVFMVFGLSALVATKVMIGFGIVLSGITMYYFARELLDEYGAMLASILFVFAPYHALNLYVRGAVGEIWAYAFIPLALWGFLKIAKKPSMRTIAIAAIGFAGVIISHNLTALMLLPFLLGEVLILFFKTKSFETRKALVLGLLFSFLLSSWYFLPAIAEMGYTNVASQAGGGSDYKDHFVCLSQLWSSQWGFGGSTTGCLDGLSFQIGKIHILLAMGGLVLGVLITSLKKRRLSLLLALGAVTAVVLLLPVSKPVWDSLSFMRFLQFPWRFLQLVLFFISVLGGLFLTLLRELLPKKLTLSAFFKVGVLVLLLAVALFYSKLFKPQFYADPYLDQTQKKTIRWTISKISDEYLPSSFIKPATERDVPQTIYQPAMGTKVTVQKNTAATILLRTNSESDGHLVLNLAYFPSWHILVDDHKASYAVGHGLYDIVIPKGDHILKAQFVETPLEKLANTLSLIGIVVLIVGIIRKKSIFNL